MTRPVPLLGDIALDAVQRVEHALDGGFAATRIAGLPGELQQRTSRGSHRIQIAGVLHGEGAADQLKTLQQQAADGAELTFAANITTALDLQKVVITGFRVVELAGQADRYSYELSLAESPPLPPPAEVSGFGGLDDFGLGDLGFDTDILGDIADLAGDIADAVDSALDVINALDALAGLGDLGGFGGVFDPLNEPMTKVGEVANSLVGGISALSEAFGS